MVDGFKNVCLFLVVSHLAGCAQISPRATDVGQNSARPAILSLVQVEQLRPGQTTSDSVKKILGSPDEHYAESSSLPGKVWLYFEQPFKANARVSILFKPNSEVISSVTWQVRSDDPEQSLSKATSRYKAARFARRDAVWTNPHINPDEIFFEDKIQGLSIAVSKSRKRVSAISWVDPQVAVVARAPNEERSRVKFEIGGISD